MSRSVEVSRRTFMTGAAAAVFAGSNGGSAVREVTAEEPTGVRRMEVDRFGQPGSPSRQAERAWAEAEYDHYQQRMRGENAQQEGPSGGNSSGSGSGSPTAPNFSRTVDAVKDLGADPSGNRPVSEDIDSSDLSDGTLIVFPPGTYLVPGKWSLSGGKIGIAGAGYEKVNSPPKPGKNTAIFVAPSGTRARITFTATTGLFTNVVLDQRRKNNSIGLVIETDGFNQARDVRFVGTQDNTNSPADEDLEVPHCALRATNLEATARAERVVGRGVGLPGTKESGGAMFFWVGDGHKGTAQMGHCTVTNTADNALYGSRTPGTAQVKGGIFHNNAVSQLRISGKGSWIDGATISIDAENYQGPRDGAGYNEKYGTNGVKVERGDEDYGKDSGVVIRDTEIQVASVGGNGMGALVLVRGSGGAVKIENCRLVNEVGGISVRAEPPGQGYSGGNAPAPHNITITDSLFTGSSGEVNVSGRKNSLIRKTCFKVPGASSSSVSGMKIGSGVGFGKQCKSGGLKAPKKVGSSGNLSAVNVSYNGSGTAGASASATQTPPRARAQGSASGSFFAALFGGFFGGIGLLLMMMVLLPLAGLMVLWQLLSS